jgi:hypothetical protein
MRTLHRKTAPGVRNGEVQRKSNWRQTPDYDITPQPRVFIDRRRPGPGYRHLLRKRDIERFVRLLPEWPELSWGLNAIVLAPGSPELFGYHRRGIVAVCGWKRELVECWPPNVADLPENRFFLDLFRVPMEPADGDCTFCHFTETTARAFQLLAVLLHELGHHHDRMTTRSRRRPGRGEPYADRYAIRETERLWERYLAEFGW